MKKLIPIFLMAFFMSGCAIGQSSYSESFFAMDTYMTVTVNSENSKEAVKKAEDEIKKLDKTLSAHDKNGGIYKLNKNGSAKLPDDGVKLVKQALRFSKMTDGAFNPALLKVTKLWGFPDKNYRVPDKNKIEEALKTAEPSNISVSGKMVVLKDGTQIDLGAIAKGYASEKIINEFKKSGVESALVNLGGNVQALGVKPDGSMWNVAIEHPKDKNSYLGQLRIKDKAVVTSGAYERYFKKNGRVYHHILNPENGFPADSGLMSVTIVSKNGTICDALSTSLYVMGEKKAEKFWAASNESFDIILYTNSGKLIISEGIADSFTSDIEYKVIKRTDYE